MPTPYIAKDRRHAIVDRVNNDGITYVHAAAIQDPDELAFALRFLFDHYTYKRSKSGGVQPGTLQDVLNAAAEAFDSFVYDVSGAYGVTEPQAHGRPAHEPISGLGAGDITNPYNFI